MKQIIIGTITSVLTAVISLAFIPYTVTSNQQATPTRLTGPNCNGVGTIEALSRRNLRIRPELGNAELFSPQRFLEPSAKAKTKGMDSTCKFFLLSSNEWVYNEGLVFSPAQVATGTPQRPTVTPTVTITPTSIPSPVFVRVRVNNADLGILELREGEPINFSVERVSK